MSALMSSVVEEEAYSWVARMDADLWTAQDEAELQAWIKSDPLRASALLQAQAAWLSVDQAREESVDVDAKPNPARARPSRRVVLSAGGALAASLVGGLMLLKRGRTYTTDIGEITRVPLADGSSAAINSGSELTVMLDRSQRNVSIVRGEAWFRVAKDAARPFVVEAGPVTVRALGTAFSVRRRADGADVIVSEGIVETWTSGLGGQKVRLMAGDCAFIGNNSGAHVRGGPISAVDRTLAWREGMIDLSGETLARAVEEFNRYNLRKLVLVDGELAGQEVDGIFRTDDPVSFAHAVGDSFKVPVNEEDPTSIMIGTSNR